MVADHYVVDTGVFALWFLAQNGWEEARKYRDRFINDEIVLETVECARFELPHVLRTKGLVPGHLDIEEYLAAARSIDDLGIAVTYTDTDALDAAASLAAQRQLRFFDAVFVHRAIVLGCPLLTTDVRLARATQTMISTIVLGASPI